jgi:hypothetical protein
MSGHPEQAKRSWRIALQRFLFGRTSLEAQLYPPLGAEVVFRIYEPRDFEACLTIYRKNEPGRFPPDQGVKFVDYLKNEEKAFIVAESNSRVVGYGGMNLLSSNVAALCYGIVDPEFQKQRIGTALILLRVAQLPSCGDGAFFPDFCRACIHAHLPPVWLHRERSVENKRRQRSSNGSSACALPRVGSREIGVKKAGIVSPRRFSRPNFHGIDL